MDEVIGAVIVPDQGTSKVRDHPDFAAAAAPLGNRLSIHDQPNLGGSGGYSRVMYEALKNTDCQQILFMDDDIRIEPDSILRALAMNRFAKTPTLVGGQMLNLQEPSHLHVMGEMVDRANFMWTAAPHTEYDHDFAEYPLNDKNDRQQAAAPPHRRRLQRLVDVHDPARRSPRSWASRCRCSSNGTTPTTACAPPSTATRPSRCPARRSGTWRGATRTTPSTGRPTSTCATGWWSRPCTGTATSAGLVRSHLKATLKHLLCLEYSTVAIQNKAMDDFLAGPEHIFSILESALPEVHRMRKEYPDAVVLPAATELPPPSAQDARR